MRHLGKFENLHALYCLLANGWVIYDNSGPAPLVRRYYSDPPAAPPDA